MFKIVITDYVNTPTIEKKIFGKDFNIVCLDQEDEKLFSNEIIDADVILVWHAKITKVTLKRLNNCKLIVKYGNILHTYKILKNDDCMRKHSWQELTSVGSILHRLLIWEYVGKTILNKPIIGHGIGTSRVIGQNIILNIPSTNIEIKGGIPLHPHNNFLQIWLELGLLGTLIISLIWIKIIKFGITIRKNSYILGTGVCTSIVTTFVICNLTFGAFQAWWMASIGLIFLVMFQSYRQQKSI